MRGQAEKVEGWKVEQWSLEDGKVDFFLNLHLIDFGMPSQMPAELA